MPALPRDLIMELMGAAVAGGESLGAFDPTRLREFLGGAGANNQWLDLGEYSTYLRRGNGRFPAKGTALKRPLELANVERKDFPEDTPRHAKTDIMPAGRRPPRGRFREMLALMEKEALKQGYDSLYVENIFNKFLPDVLESTGYAVDPSGPPRGGMMPPSMYKRLGQGVQPGRGYF